MDPKRVSLGRVSRKGPPARKMVTLTPGDAGPLKLKLAPVDVQGLEAELRELEPGERYELEITATPPFKNDRLRGKLILKTGFEPAPEVSIPVYAVLPPRLSANPNRVRIPANRDSEWRQVIRVVWDEEPAHKVLSATVDDPELTVLLTEAEGEQQVVLAVPQAYSLQARRTITITTDDTQAPQVRVPVMGTRPPPARRAKRRPAASARAGKAQPATAKPAPTTQPAQGPSGTE